MYLYSPVLTINKLQLAPTWANRTTLPIFNVFVAQMDPVRLGLYVKKMSMEKKNVLSNVRVLARGLNCVIFFIGHADVELLHHVHHSLGDLCATL